MTDEQIKEARESLYFADPSFIARARTLLPVALDEIDRLLADLQHEQTKYDQIERERDRLLSGRERLKAQLSQIRAEEREAHGILILSATSTPDMAMKLAHVTH